MVLSPNKAAMINKTMINPTSKLLFTLPAKTPAVNNNESPGSNAKLLNLFHKTQLGTINHKSKFHDFEQIILKILWYW